MCKENALREDQMLVHPDGEWIGLDWGLAGSRLRMDQSKLRTDAPDWEWLVPDRNGSDMYTYYIYIYIYIIT